MIGKDDPGIDREGTAAPNMPNRLAQEIDPVDEQSLPRRSRNFTVKK
jgi:hypothetical protein